MNVQIRDDQALRAMTPAALAAYACGEGWARLEAYGQQADVYSHPDRPELIIPRTDALADYASVVAQLIAILAETSGRDALALYRDLLGADRDVIRIRAAGDANDGSVPLVAAEGLVTHTREMLLAAACAASSLERTGQRWQLTNAELVSIGAADEDDVNDNRTDAVKLAD